ncbi:unnamed protein product [Gongylonema pulchrum]|uniref:DUF4148 domain-containing protein n=1 Tax=Gongylonema pulchrum TaxID=637853 RepID=A0A183F1Q2_9BILA|nr:unnamed protein product [Gongylonema pulchrum]
MRSAHAVSQRDMNGSTMSAADDQQSVIKEAETSAGATAGQTAIRTAGTVARKSTGAVDSRMVRSESAFAAVSSDPVAVTATGGFRFVENGGRPIDRSRPLRFPDAVRLHDSLSAHNVRS